MFVLTHRLPHVLALCAFMSACLGAGAATQLTEHTYKLEKDEKATRATLDDVAWLAGSWDGEAFGDRFEETWNPPSNGSMVGTFKLLKDDGVAFYEILLLVEDGNSVSMKVKHFNADFTAWEEKSDYVTFRLIKATPMELIFSGLSFYRSGNDEINAYIAIRQDGVLREEKLVFRRRK